MKEREVERKLADLDREVTRLRRELEAERRRRADGMIWFVAIAAFVLMLVVMMLPPHR